MNRIILSAASAIAMISGAALAQSTDQTTTTPQYQPETAATEATTPDSLAVTTKADATTFAKKEFAMLDTNGDKKIEKAEFIAAAETMMAKDHMAMNEPVTGAADETATAQTQVAQGDGEETIDQTFMGLAKNDETVTEKELVAARIEDFAQADANADGSLDETEKARFAELVKLGGAA